MTTAEFIRWVANEVMESDDDFKENSERFQEICCRKLVRLGVIKLENVNGKNMYVLKAMARIRNENGD